MKKELNLGKEKIGKLLLAFSVPCIISMIINSIYNIVDQIFIGKGVGIIGNAATNVIFPVVIICNALAGLVGNGAAANLSLRLGEGKKETGLSEKFIEENEQKHNIIGSSEYNNDDKLFIAESKVIKNISKESCVIVGRCSPYVLKDNKDVLKIFLYSDEESKIKRVVKYYNIPKDKAKKEIEKVNKMRDKHYKYYTGLSIYNPSNYDLMINVDSLGVMDSADYIIDYIFKEK